MSALAPTTTDTTKHVYLIAINPAGTRFAAYINDNNGEPLRHVWPIWDGDTSTYNHDLQAEAKRQGFSVQLRNLNAPRFFIEAAHGPGSRLIMHAATIAHDILRNQGENSKLAFFDLNGRALLSVTPAPY